MAAALLSLPGFCRPLGRHHACTPRLLARTFIVAIDGPAASGKSTTAKRVARTLGYNYIDSGSIYRAITLKALAQGLDLTQEADRQRLDGLAHTCQVDTQAQFDGDTLRVVTYLDGQDVTDAIRTLAVNRGVSEVAKAPEVRQAVLQIQRRMAGYKREGSETTTDKLSTTDLVMDGRDIGTSVFPQAELKVYLEADAAVRAQRRYEEMQRQAMAKKENRSTLPTYDEVLRDLQARDAADVNRTHSPLRRAPDAVVIDSTNLTIDQQVNKIVELAQSRMA